MNPPNFNNFIEFIGEFLSEVPPQVLAIILSILTLALYVAGGTVVASIVGFLALYVTKSGPTIISICALLVAASSIYGLIMAIKNYKNIMLSYENNKT